MASTRPADTGALITMEPIAGKVVNKAFTGEKLEQAIDRLSRFAHNEKQGGGLQG